MRRKQDYQSLLLTNNDARDKALLSFVLQRYLYPSRKWVAVTYAILLGTGTFTTKTA